MKDGWLLQFLVVATVVSFSIAMFILSGSDVARAICLLVVLLAFLI